MEENDLVDIVLIEDNSDDAELTIRALKKNKIPSVIKHLKDGAEAIEYFFCTGKYLKRNIDAKPKVVMLDLNMPKVSGIEVLRMLKSDMRTRSIPVIVLTSSRESPDVQICYQLGANSYIVKPVGYENFTEAITELGLYWLLRNQQHE